LKRILHLLAVIEDALLAILLGAMILVAGLQIFLRNLFDSSISWGDPALRVAVLWIGLLGAMAATRDDRQISIDALSRFLPGRFSAPIRVLTDVFTAGVSGFLSWHAVRLIFEDRASGMTVFASIPVWVCELILPLAFGVIALRYLVYAFRHISESLHPEAGQ